MAEPVYKILYFMKRRPGMSVADFRDYYENHHSKFVQKYITSDVKRYVRRYIDDSARREQFDGAVVPRRNHCRANSRVERAAGRRAELEGAADEVGKLAILRPAVAVQPVEQ